MIRYTEEEYQQTVNRVRGGRPALAAVQAAVPSLPDKRQDAPSPFRSKLEAAYAGYLHTLMIAGDIKRYAYEPIRLNLAPKTTLTPDFLVEMPDGSLELHEVKGWAREDAMVKLKVAARLYPFWKFWLVKKFRGEWKLRELPNL